MKTTADYIPNVSPILADLHQELKKIDAQIQYYEGLRAGIHGAIASLEKSEQSQAPKAAPEGKAGSEKPPGKKSTAPAPKIAAAPKSPKPVKQQASKKVESKASPALDAEPTTKKSSGKTTPPMPVGNPAAESKSSSEDGEISELGALFDKALDQCGATFTNQDVREKMQSINATLADKAGKNYISNRFTWLEKKKVVIQTNPDVAQNKPKIWKRG